MELIYNIVYLVNMHLLLSDWVVHLKTGDASWDGIPGEEAVRVVYRREQLQEVLMTLPLRRDLGLSHISLS